MSEHHNNQHPDAPELDQPNRLGSEPATTEASAANAHPEREAGAVLHPRIWVASLADYTAGRLHGDWFDAAVNPAELRAAIDTMLSQSREPDAEEWAIFDYDEFGGYRVEEYDQIDDITAVACGIAAHGPAFAAWAEIHNGDPDMLMQFEDCFLGTYDNPTDWAREVLGSDDIEHRIDTLVPTSLQPYVRIDYEAFADDARLSGSVHIEASPDGRVWVFQVI